MDPLSQLQHDLANLLLGDPALAVVPVTTYKQFVITDTLAEDLGPWQVRVAPNIGVAIQVRLPAIRSKYSNVPGPQLEIEQTIRIFEDPVTNNTGLTAEAVGMEILRWIDGTRFEGITELESDTKNPALKPVYDYPDRFCYDAVFIGQFPQDYTPRVTAPNLSDDGHGNITLTCADGAASIYYSTDGNCPVPGDAAKLYSAPFPVTAGTTIVWFAYYAPLKPSYIQTAKVS